jgi:hypothetical protein
MTDSIDLDDIDVQDDEGEAGPNRGDWLWRAEGDPGEEPPDVDGGLTGADIGDRTPRVPSETDGKPVGIPTDSGGAGSGVDAGDSEPGVPADADPDAPSERGDPNTSGDGADTASPSEETEVWDVDEDAVPDAAPTSGSEPAGTAATDATVAGTASSDGVSGPVGSGASAGGPHGGDADEMTLAFTYRAARALDDPSIAYGDAKQWTDWLGIVGDVPSHALNKFQRRHTIDLDFFNGAATRPSERLAEIGPSSMFYAERLVLVGLPDEAGMEPDGWEFRPLPEAAEKAGWGYSLPDDGGD